MRSVSSSIVVILLVFFFDTAFSPYTFYVYTHSSTALQHILFGTVVWSI